MCNCIHWVSGETEFLPHWCNHCSWLSFQNCFPYLLFSSCIIRLWSQRTHHFVSLTYIHNRKMFVGTKKEKPCESPGFAHQKFQLDRVHLQEAKRSSYEHTKKCADQLLLLGQVSITQLQGPKAFFFTLTVSGLHWYIHTHKCCHVSNCAMFEQ